MNCKCGPTFKKVSVVVLKKNKKLFSYIIVCVLWCSVSGHTISIILLYQ